MGTDADVVTDLVARRSTALVAGDRDAMAAILADDFTYTNASGAACDREEYLAAYVGSPDVVWESQEASGLEVRVYGDTAVVTVDVHDRFAWRGELVEGDFRSLFVYVRGDGAWRCVAGHTTARG